jgi:hypothetical protein
MARPIHRLMIARDRDIAEPRIAVNRTGTTLCDQGAE